MPLKIAIVAAGAAGMYCGSCLHDNTLAQALHEAGDEVTLVPTYTPLRTDEPNASVDRVFLGGINVFLQQHSALFRHTPTWLDAVWDRPALLRQVSRLASATAPEKLGPLTVSMLQGEQGRQRKSLRTLVDWLAHEVRPEIVHLSNVMLLGFARPLREALGVPVVCSLAGEDVFLEKLPAPHYDQVRALLRERACDVDRLIALNEYFAGFMAEYLAVDRARICVVPHGLRLDGHLEHSRRTPPSKPIIGYLARICPDKGLHLLAEAFIRLAQQPEWAELELHVAGYLGSEHRSYLDTIGRQVATAGLTARFQVVGELDRAAKIAFLQSLSVLSVPTVYRESKGLPVLEAWANAVPVVVPDHGAFSELLADTQAGLLCEAENVDSLSARLAELLADPSLATACGRRGHAAVRERYRADVMARQTQTVYRELLEA